MTQLAVPVPPSLQSHRSDLRQFWEGMTRKLDMNSYKSLTNTPDKSISGYLMRIKDELMELEKQLIENPKKPNALEEACDVANSAYLLFRYLINTGTMTATEEMINEYLEIEPIEGKVYCKKSRAGAQYKPGQEIRGSKRDGYVDIKIQNTRGGRKGLLKSSVPRSHLVWWKAKGVWPTGIIDHDNRIRNDDRISNLKDSSFTDNNLNKARRKYPPFVTIYTPKGRNHLKHYGKFVYSRYARGVNIRVGYFDTPEDASTLGEKAWAEKVNKLIG